MGFASDPVLGGGDAAAIAFPVPPPNLRLHLLPDEVLHRILGALLEMPPNTSPYAPFSLRGRSFERAQEAHALARTSRRFRDLFRRSTAALDIHWDDCVGAGVVAFFAPSLKRLAVSRHAQTPCFIDALAAGRPPLVSLALIGCPVVHATLAEAVRALAPTLVEFSLEYVNSAAGSTVAATCAALAHCVALERLSLHGFPDLSLTSLALVLRECDRLRTLSIGYLRHASMGPSTLDAIAACPRLDTLALHDTRWANVLDVVGACTQLGPQLRCLSLDGVQGLADDTLAAIVASCPRLVALTVRCDEPGSVTARGIVAAVQALASNLRSLDVSGTIGIGDDEMPAILAAAPSLRELRLRHAVRCTNAAMFEIATLLHRTLYVLDITGTSTSDEGLAALGACSALTALHIGTSNVLRLPAFMQQQLGGGAGAQRPAIISNMGLEELLRGCGKSLRRFQCGDIQAAQPAFAPAQIPFGNGGASAGRSLLGGTGIFRSLLQHCSPALLDTVVIQKLTPPLSARVDRARMHLRMIELEEACPECCVYLDREPPPLPPMTLDELLN
jgi:hypothetical protein